MTIPIIMTPPTNNMNYHGESLLSRQQQHREQHRDHHDSTIQQHFKRHNSTPTYDISTIGIAIDLLITSGYIQEKHCSTGCLATQFSCHTHTQRVHLSIISPILMLDKHMTHVFLASTYITTLISFHYETSFYQYTIN